MMTWYSSREIVPSASFRFAFKSASATPAPVVVVVVVAALEDDDDPCATSELNGESASVGAAATLGVSEAVGSEVVGVGGGGGASAAAAPEASFAGTK
jgi:hypothetical protein